MSSTVLAANPSPAPSPRPTLPTSQDEIAKGFIPYHRLTLEDFPINDQVHPDSGFWVKTFVDPFWLFQFRFSRSSIYAYIGGWVVFSGLDRNESSRRSWFRDMKAYLPYAQALLDINEIHARRLAALSAGELPRGQGTSMEATRADLTSKMKLFCEKEYEQIRVETDAFAKATNKGSNQKRVAEIGTDIKKRLAAMPLPNFSPLSGVAAAATPTPGATAAASSAAAPSVTPRSK